MADADRLETLRGEPVIELTVLRGCRRCGHTHGNVTVVRLANPGMPELSHYYLCPITGAPALLRFRVVKGKVVADGV